MIHKPLRKTNRLPTPIKWNILACGLVIDWLLTFTNSWNSSHSLYAVTFCTWNLFIDYSTHFLSAPNTGAVMYAFTRTLTNKYLIMCTYR